MKLRHWKERQTLNRAKQFDDNYLSARDCENNSKLANLLNLSQFNFDNMLKKPNASTDSVLTSSKLVYRKSPLINAVLCAHNSNTQIFKQSNSQNSPSKINSSKHKKSKHSKRHILSCNQILNIAKKRDVYSALSLQPTKSHILAHFGQTKTKKKFKKEILLSKNQTGAKPRNDNPPADDPKHGGGPKPDEQSRTSFIVNYPLSMSHSYIAFSEKDSSLNNTANVVSKLQKKQSKTSESKYAELKNKLEIIKFQHAATVIQKNWRGYLTRKLLLDYIHNQESILVDRLSRIKAEKLEYENFQKMIPECNKFWTSREKDSPSMFEPNAHKNEQNNSPCFQSKPDRSMDDNKTSSIDNQQSESDSQVYERKSPVLTGKIDQHQLLQTILQYQTSANITSREKNKQQFQGTENQEGMNQIGQSAARNQQQGRPAIHLRRLSIVHQYNDFIILNPEIDSLQPIDIRNELDLALKSFAEKFKNQISEKIQKQNKILKKKLMDSLIQFDNMLSERQKLKRLKSDLEEQTDKFLENTQKILDQICQPNTSQKQQKQNLPIIPNVQLPLTQKEKRQLNSLFQDQTQSPIGANQNRSPVSEYFTIQLPTQELSPFKPRVSSGLESLKTYIQNLHLQCLQQSEETSETSFLCKVLKKHSQIGPQNMVERCLIQMLVEMLTGQFMLEDLLFAASLLINQNQQVEKLKECPSVLFIKKWALELEKWELGPIEEVSGNMEESEDVTERNQTGKKLKNLDSKQWLKQFWS